MKPKRASANVIAIFIAMCFAAALALGLRPSHSVEAQSQIDLAAIIPRELGEWRTDTSITPVLVSADIQAQLDKTYNQILARTYVNSRGERVMLSVAYGRTQSRVLQVHRPEVCYAAQGFEVQRLVKGEVSTTLGRIPVMRLRARMGIRNEPITYWIRIGNRIVRGNLEQGMARLASGLAGDIPDGLLVRVSTLETDEIQAWHLHGRFVGDLLAAVTDQGRQFLVGTNK